MGDLIEVTVPCPYCSDSERRGCKECHHSGVTTKTVPESEAHHYVLPTREPLANEALAGLPGVNRREKRQRAKLAQRAFVKNKRRWKTW